MSDPSQPQTIVKIPIDDERRCVGCGELHRGVNAEFNCMRLTIPRLRQELLNEKTAHTETKKLLAINTKRHGSQAAGE